MRGNMIVAGHLCVDITPVFPNGTRKSIPELLVPGKLIYMDPATVHTGGVVANTGLALKKLGANVRLVGKLGDDAFGNMVKEILRSYEADQDVLVDASDSTSYSIVLTPPGVDRIFLHNPGANDRFCADDIPEHLLEDAALFHFGYPPIMKKMYQDDGEELLKLFMRVREKGAAVSLDLAAVDPESEAGKADWKRILEKVLPYVDFFVPSAEELCYMLDAPRYEEWIQRAAGRDVTEILDTEKDIRPLVRQAMELGVKVLMLKCGVNGIYYAAASEEVLREVSEKIELDISVWSDKSGFQRSFVPDRVRSGAGAGDTSIAAFLYAMCKGYAPEKCVELAAAEGASSVEEFDALSGVQTLEALEARIRAGWRLNG